MLKVLGYYLNTYHLKIDIYLGITDDGWCTPYINIFKNGIWLSIELRFLNIYLEIDTRFHKYQDS
uniref:Uncharacterized protein n=1 Tax=Geladintestivirus 6 TaxID=3233138 RepID=A0AAU8MK35_9CAUD